NRFLSLVSDEIFLTDMENFRFLKQKLSYAGAMVSSDRVGGLVALRLNNNLKQLEIFKIPVP
ncbi:MAG: hypothetical protein AAGA30_17820, partial [Planctomycetota bacterium]